MPFSPVTANTMSSASRWTTLFHSEGATPPYLLPKTSPRRPCRRGMPPGKRHCLSPDDGLAEKVDAQRAPLLEADAFPVHPFAQEILIHHGPGSNDKKTRHVKVLTEEIADFRPLPLSALERRRCYGDLLERLPIDVEIDLPFHDTRLPADTQGEERERQ